MMDNNDTIDPLGDTTPLPELSFEDLLDNSKPDSLMHGLVDTIEMNEDFNDNGNVVDDFAVQKNESLNTPGPKKVPAIKILENRKLCTTTIPTVSKTAQHDEKAVAKIMTKMSTQSKSSTLVTPSKILINTKPKSMQSPIFKLTNKTDGVADLASTSGSLATPKTIGNAATLTTIDGKPAVKTAEGKILFIQKASGFGQVGNTASQLSNIRLQPSSSASVLSAVTGSTTGVLKASPIVGAKPIGSISGQQIGHTMMTIVSKTTTNTTGSVASLPKPLITGTSTLTGSIATTKPLSAKPTTTSQLETAKSTCTTKLATAVSDGDFAPITATAGAAATTATTSTTTLQSVSTDPKTSKISPKPMQIQIVRTSDGKLVKLKQSNIVSSGSVLPAISTAPKTNVMKSSAASNVPATGKIVIKTPLKNVTTELLTKNLTIKKVTASSTTATTTITTPVTKSPTTGTSSITSVKTTVNMSPTTKPVTKMILAGAIKSVATTAATNKASGNSTPLKLVDATKIETKTQPLKTIATTSTSVAGTLSNKDVDGTTANVPKVLNRIIMPASSAATANTTSSSPTATATTMAGKVVVQSTSGGTPIVVSNQQLIKLSPKSGRVSNLTAVGGGNAPPPKVNNVPCKVQAVQLAGKGGIKYVRVLPKGATITNTATTTAKIAEKAAVKLSTSASASTTTATATASTASTTCSAATANSNGGTKTTTTALATNTILNSTLATPVASTSSSGFKILNSAPQKFTLVRSSQGATKFLLKQSPKKDGPVSVVSMPQKKLIANKTNTPTTSKSTSLDNTATVAAASTSTATDVGASENTRKHKISDINLDIKRITGANASASGGQSSNTVSDDTVAPEPKKPRYVFVPHNKLQYSKVGNQSQVTRAGYTLQRLSTASTASANESSGTSSAGINKNKPSTSKQVYSILRTNKGSGTKSYVVCNTATGQKSITVRRPFSLNETAVGKAKKFVSTSDLLERREKILKNDAVRSQGVPVKFTTKPQYDVLRQTITTTSSSVQSQAASTSSTSSTGATAGASLDNVLSRRKHCNCSKSQCLKLYCDCFANGEFCQDCTCKDCFNNLQYEDERQRAIKSCLDRNPSAFKPKITARQHSDMRLHNKGCNCKRSGCLKNYCECYEAKIPCSSICKCVGCRNMEDRPDVDLDYLDSKTLSGLTTDKRKIKTEPTDVDNSSPPVGNNFITDDVIDATIMCMLSQLTECEKQEMQENDIEKQIMEELGRCLVEIIDFSIRNSDSILLDESKAG